MSNEIFTEEELKGAEAAPGEEQKPAPGETEEQKAARERDEQGRFKAKEPVDGEVEEGKDKGGTVPQQALHAEREKRKASEAELAKARELLDGLAKMREQIASRKPEDLPPADDPAAIDHLRKRLAELEQGQTKITQHMDSAAVNAAEIQQIGAIMHQSEASYRQEHPDYDEAISHVVTARAQELALYGLNPAQISQTISEEATEIVRSAIAQGRDPAELGYQIALSRGYRPKSGEEQQNGGDKTVAQRTLDAIAAAKAAGKSVGQASGKTPKMLNAEAVLAMSPEEFEAVYSTPEGKAMIDAL